MGNTELQSSKVETELGVFVDEELKFHQHISFAVNKASRMLWLIKNAFSYLDEDTLPVLYKALTCQTPPGIWKHYLASTLSDG